MKRKKVIHGAKKTGSFVFEMVKEWQKDRVMQLSASLAFYTIFSLPPILILLIVLVGFFYGTEAVEGRIVHEIQGLIGKSGAEAVQNMIKNAQRPELSNSAAILGISTLIFTASGVFAQLQDSLNRVWGVEPKPNRGYFSIIKDRLLSFTIVLGMGFLMMVSLSIDAILSFFEDYLILILKEDFYIYFIKILNYLISFLFVSTLFGMIYKILPDVKIAWKDVVLGSLVTSLLFTIGKVLIGLYLGNSDVGSAYGAAGSVIIIFIWIFYASIIFFFGAEFTQIYARRYGSHLMPNSNAVVIDTDKFENSRLKNKEIRHDVCKRLDKEIVAIPIKKFKPLRYNIKNKEDKKNNNHVLSASLKIMSKILINNYLKGKNTDKNR